MHQRCRSCTNDVCSGCDFEWEAKPLGSKLETPPPAPTQLRFCLCNQNWRPQYSPGSLGLVPAVNQYSCRHYRTLLHNSGRRRATGASAPPVGNWKEELRMFSCCQRRALCFPRRKHCSWLSLLLHRYRQPGREASLVPSEALCCGATSR